MMHVSELGILQYVQGSIMWDLFKHLKGTFAAPTRACGRLLQLVKLHSRLLNIEPPFSALTVTMFRGKGTIRPKFKLKAAEGRYFVAVLRQILIHCFPCESEYERKRLQLLETMHTIYEEMKAWRGLESTHLLGQCARRHFILLKELNRLCPRDPTIWTFAPKHHIFLHLCESSYSNPALHWCYSDEGAIGRCCEVADGMHPSHLHRQLISHYCLTRPWLSC